MSWPPPNVDCCCVHTIDMLPCEQAALYSSTPSPAYEAAVQALLVPVQDSLAAMTSEDGGVMENIEAATAEEEREDGRGYSHTVTIGKSVFLN